MVGADLHFGACSEDKLLILLQGTVQTLQGLYLSERTSDAEGPGSELPQDTLYPPGHENSSVLKIFSLLREWSALHTHRAGFLREALSTTVHSLKGRDKDANHGRIFPKQETQTVDKKMIRFLKWCPNCLRCGQDITTPNDRWPVTLCHKVSRITGERATHRHIRITDIILNVLEDLHSIEKKLSSITSKSDRAITILTKLEIPNAKNETTRGNLEVRSNAIHQDRMVHPDTFSEHHCDLHSPECAFNMCQSAIQKCAPQNRQKADSYGTCERKTDQNSSNEVCNESPIVLGRGKNKLEEGSFQRRVLKSPRNYDDGPRSEVSGEVKTVPIQDGEEEKSEKAKAVNEGECVSWTHNWTTVGLKDSAISSSKTLCYVSIPLELTKLITCKVVDGLSALMVSGSEELVSRVLRLEHSSGVKCPFPLTVALPFLTCHRLNYREITVKLVDQKQRVSYVTPVATEGIYGGKRGSFAVVRVYTLGVFAVLSRLQREIFTIPKRGLALKLSVDSRICLDYLPGSFTTPVVAQALVQPVDATLLSTLKSKNYSYQSILSTSPLVYLNQPSTVSPRRPFTLTLPCPPNPEKRKRTGEENSGNYQHSLRLTPDTLPAQRVSASLQPPKEQLAVLGWKDEQWTILDKVSVKNMQNSLVSFELMENYERLVVLRLLSSVRPSDLASFAEELQEAVRTYAVTVVMYNKQKNLNNVVLAVLPSRGLKWWLAELRAQAYCGSPEQSSEIFMREGEQLLLKFSGNITSTGDRGMEPHTVTFHVQNRNRLYLQLKEQDPFGNHSSPHYKGTALLFRVPRDQLVWRGDRAVISEHDCLEEPVCKLSITLPKIVKPLSHPLSAKFLRHDQSEPLCDELLIWLSRELSEEDGALLASCLHLRRSSVQLARLRAPHSAALQTFHILSTWRQTLPSFTPKCPLLACCLTSIGRPELAAELMRKSLTKDTGLAKVCLHYHRFVPSGANTLILGAHGDAVNRH